MKTDEFAYHVTHTLQIKKVITRFNLLNNYDLCEKSDLHVRFFAVFLLYYLWFCICMHELKFPFARINQNFKTTLCIYVEHFTKNTPWDTSYIQRAKNWKNNELYGIDAEIKFKNFVVNSS